MVHTLGILLTSWLCGGGGEGRERERGEGKGRGDESVVQAYPFRDIPPS